MWCQGLCWGPISVPLHACCPTQCLHWAARGCLWGGGAGLSCRGEGTRSLMLRGWDPKISLELSAQLRCAHLAWLPGAPCAALSLPLYRTGERTHLSNSWVEAQSVLFFLCLKPKDNKLCVSMATYQCRVFCCSCLFVCFCTLGISYWILRPFHVNILFETAPNPQHMFLLFYII